MTEYEGFTPEDEKNPDDYTTVIYTISNTKALRDIFKNRVIYDRNNFVTFTNAVASLERGESLPEAPTFRMADITPALALKARALLNQQIEARPTEDINLEEFFEEFIANEEPSKNLSQQVRRIIQSLSIAKGNIASGSTLAPNVLTVDDFRTTPLPLIADKHNMSGQALGFLVSVIGTKVKNNVPPLHS